MRSHLTDPVPLVRLRAAQGLLAARDKESIPTLIALLDEPMVAVSWQAEELLHWVAEEQAPRGNVGAASAEMRRRCRVAWEAWWRDHRQRLDTAPLDQEPRRPTLFLLRDEGDPERETGCVFLCGWDGKVRWQIGKLSRPTFNSCPATGC